MTAAWWLVIILASALIWALLVLSFERKKAGEVNPGQERYYAGLRALLRGDQEIAFQRFKQAVTEDSSNVDAYLRIGNLLRERGQERKALSIHTDLLQRGKLDKETHIAVRRALADDYIALGSVDEAIEILTELGSEKENELWVARKLHRLYLERGNFEDAFKIRQKLMQRGDPAEPVRLALYLVMAGVKAADGGEHRRGRIFLRDALKQDPACRAAHYYMGDFYERDGRLEDAVRAWKNFLEAAPAQAALVFPRLEKVLFELGQYSEIAGIYQQVLAADPVNTDALVGMALFSEKKGDTQRALEYLRQVIEIDPGHLFARQKLVQIHREAGNQKDAWMAADGFFTWLPSLADGYTCNNCGHKVKEPRWYCPRCRRFDTFDLGARKQAAEVASAPVAG